jgi:hypothetical protein
MTKRNTPETVFTFPQPQVFRGGDANHRPTHEKGIKVKHPGRLLGAAAMIAAVSSGATLLGESLYHDATANHSGNSSLPYEATPQQVAELVQASERLAAAQQIDQLNNGLDAWVFKQPIPLAENKYGNPILVESNISYTTTNKGNESNIVHETNYAYCYVDTDNPPDFKLMNGQSWLNNYGQQLIVEQIPDQQTLFNKNGTFDWNKFTKGSLNSNGELYINTSGNKAALAGFVESTTPILQP